MPELIQAFADVCEQNKRARLVIAGKPSKHMNMTALHKMVTDLHLSNAVVFDSRYLDMEEIAPLMELASVVVYPYHSITQSGALQAAYAFGKPVVATNVGGFPEAVEDGKNGFWSRPGLRENWQLPFQRSSMIRYGERKWGHIPNTSPKTRFAWEPIAGTILDVYSELLKNK
ncbi:MAG: glycosyltransferase [Anaerolineales bacterium]|nr:glycosyltransferase [Anaerolineales bacterium]